MPVENMVIRPKKKVAPAILSYVVALTYVLIAGFLLKAVIYKQWSWLSIPILLIIFDFILSKCFAWYTQTIFTFDKDSLEIKVFTKVDVLGTNYTSYKLVFDEITSLNFKADKVTFKGKISRKEPKMKPKDIKKLVVEDVTEEIQTKLKEIIHVK